MRILGRLASLFVVISAFVLGAPAAGRHAGASSSPSSSSSSSGPGYWLESRDGGVLNFGDAPFLGSATQRCTFECFGFGATADGNGYWIVDSYPADRSTSVYGYGSAFDVQLHDPIGASAVASTPSGKGGWVLYGYSGIVVTFGDASFHGSMARKPLNALMIGIAANPKGTGYWTAALDGGVFSLGDAPYLGSAGSRHLDQPVLGFAARD